MSLLSAVSTLTSTAPAGGFIEGKVLTDGAIFGVDNADVDKMITNIVNKFDLASFDIDAAARLFGYEGFDPRIIYASLISSAAANNLTDDQLKDDLGLMLVLHHVKGNVSHKNFKSLKAEGQQMVNLLFDRYGLRLKPGNNKKTAVTLPRLGACFPLQMSIIALHNQKDFMGPYGSKDLPGFMKTSSFPSLIPIGDKASKFLQLSYNAYATDQHIALTKKNYSALDDAQKKLLFEEQLKFSDISYQSPVMSIDGRRLAMTLLSIGKHYKVIKRVYDATKMDPSMSVDEADWNACVRSWVINGTASHPRAIALTTS